MNGLSPASTVGQLVAERPERGRLFEELGIDYCCAGRISLERACAARGLKPDVVLARIRASDASPQTGTEPDWTAAPLPQLIDHIQSVHHQRMRADIPRAARLIAKVVGAHGQRCPELAELQIVFEAFASELLEHMQKEDTVLFPALRSLGTGTVGGAPRIDQPISVMMADHEGAGRALQRMRELTAGFTAPADACGTHRVMLAALRDIESDLHTHVHKENNILFPRAMGMVAAPAPCACACRTGHSG